MNYEEKSEWRPRLVFGDGVALRTAYRPLKEKKLQYVLIADHYTS